MSPPNLSEDRYLYYPDHLVRLPGSGFSLNNILDTARSFLTEPLWDGAVKAGIAMFLPTLRNDKEDIRNIEEFEEALAMDESVGEYFERVLDDDRVVKNILSGMMHGIYGGDVYKLSVKHTLLDGFWRDRLLPRRRGVFWMETKDLDLVYDLMRGPNSDAIKELGWKALDFSIMAFEDGLLGLLNGLAKDLKQQKNVTIKTGSPVDSLAYKGGRVTVRF